MRTTTFLVLMSFLVGGAVYADRVTLIYGDVLEGKVLQETDTTVTIRGPFGEIQLPKNEVKEIRRDGSEPQVPDQTRASSSSPAGAPGPWDQAPQAPEPAPLAPSTELPQNDTPPDPYDILKKNVEIQSQWKDLEIAYLQRAYIGGQTVQTQFIGRTIPPRYFRSKLTTPIPANPQFPQGGEVEYDMYRTGSILYQVVKAPGQPVQYLRLDLSKIPGFRPGDNQVESFRSGFVGAGTDEDLLRVIARNTQIIGSENIDGHDCWVLETVNTPELIEAQVSREPQEMRDTLRQQIMQVGRIRSWVGKKDLNQWRMENYSPQGDLLLSMKMISIKPNQGLTPQDLRMKVPKGTQWVDMTDMVATQFQQIMGGPPGIVPIPSPNQLGQPYRSAQPPEWPQQPLPAPFNQPPGAGVGTLPPTFPQQPAPPQPNWPAPQPQSYPQTPAQGAPPVQQPYSFPPPQPQQQGSPYPPQNPSSGYYQPQPPTNPIPVLPPQTTPPQNYGSYPAPGQPPPQGYPQPYPQQPQTFQQVQVPPAFVPPVQQQKSSGIGGFFKKILGGSGQNAPGVIPGGINQNGNPTVMIPMVNGQPQFPNPPR